MCEDAEVVKKSNRAGYLRDGFDQQGVSIEKSQVKSMYVRLSVCLGLCALSIPTTANYAFAHPGSEIGDEYEIVGENKENDLEVSGDVTVSSVYYDDTKETIDSLRSQLEQHKEDLALSKIKLEEEQAKHTLAFNEFLGDYRYQTNEVNQKVATLYNQLEGHKEDLALSKRKLEEEQVKHVLAFDEFLNKYLYQTDGVSEKVATLYNQLEQHKEDLALSKIKLEEEQAKNKRAFEESLNEHLYQMPFFRLSPNQLGAVSNDLLDGFTINTNGISIAFSTYKTIHSNVAWEDRDSEEREILTAMGRLGQRHFAPAPLYVVRMTWNNADIGGSGYWAFYHYINYHNWVTHASYAKLISGKIEESYFKGITDQWGLCGAAQSLEANSYTHPHPYIKSTSGEVLFTMLASVAGKFPLDREKPKWGFIPLSEGSRVFIRLMALKSGVRGIFRKLSWQFRVRDLPVMRCLDSHSSLFRYYHKTATPCFSSLCLTRCSEPFQIALYHHARVVL